MSIKPTIKTEILPLSLIVLSGLLASYFYLHFPERVVNHWNFAGIPDGYTNRLGGAISMPIVLVLMYICFLIAPMLDPKGKRYAQFEGVYFIFKDVIMLMFFAIYVFSGLFNMGYPIQINYLVPWMIGVLMMILGNFMGKIKKNWFMGIRTPWTLSSENVWNKTHRMGGWMFLVWGLVIIITPYLPQAWGLSVFLGGALGVVLGTMVYSYYLFRLEKK